MRRITFEHVVLVAAVALGIGFVANPIGDNSMLLHMRTGIDMFHNNAIPRTDPYSFTALGHPWVVQSWFAEWTYGAVHALGGFHLVVVQQMVLCALLLLIVAVLARAGTMTRTFLALISPIALIAGYSPQRPVLYGFLCFALYVLIVEKRWSPWLLLPVGWLWVNTHGSFPTGVLWFAVMFFGSIVDTRRFDRALFRYGWVFVLGLLLGALNPLGPKLLWFWTNAFGPRAEIFGKILEWRSPDFHGTEGLIALAGVIGIVTLLFLSPRSPQWQYMLPVAVFLAAALYSARNISSLAIVAAPALAYGLRFTGEHSTHKHSESSRVPIAAMLVMALVVVGMGIRLYSNPAINDKPYPVAALDKLQRMGLTGADHRIITPDFVGNYIAYSELNGTPDFIDDRFDMFPLQVAEDYRSLVEANADPIPILDKYKADAVIWQVDGSVAHVLAHDAHWRWVYGDALWVVYVRQ